MAMKKTQQKTSHGFTIIELMLVLTIVGVLSALAIPNFQGFMVRVKNAERKVSTTAIAIGLFERIQRTGTLPNVTSATDSNLATPLDPPLPITSVKKAFDLTVANSSDWKWVDWRPDGWVRFHYQVTANLTAAGGIINIYSQGDINANNIPVTWTQTYNMDMKTGTWSPADEQQAPPGEN